MDNEILKWITKHPNVILIFESVPYFANEFTIEMRVHKQPERIKYRINSLMAEHLTEIFDQMREALLEYDLRTERPISIIFSCDECPHAECPYMKGDANEQQ